MSRTNGNRITTMTKNSANYTYAIDPSAVSIKPSTHIPPFGANAVDGGVQFAVFSQSARRIWIALFNDASAQEPTMEFELDPESYRIGDIWSAEVTGIGVGAMYLLRADGPQGPEGGHRFDQTRLLLDPYARALTGAPSEGPVKCVVIELPDPISWCDRPSIPDGEVIIYETHVRGFTQHPTSGVSDHGTYAGFIEKIPHLLDLGVTIVEFLPVHASGEGLLDRTNPSTGEPLVNYWGYNPAAFFVPDPRYATGGNPTDAISEFRTLTQALHDAGIEVIVDVVYNHVSDTSPNSPVRCFAGLDNTTYFHVSKSGDYVDYTGCGNTVDCSHPAVRSLIVDSLRYWVMYLGVDGFRFDLAATLMRDADGAINRRAALIDDIARDPLLRHARLIAEPWDVGENGFQCGGFEKPQWLEWNALYRDDVRGYWRGDAHLTGAMARRLTGSHDLFEDHGRTPSHSVNFITAHDGFTLRDLVTYSEKHNLENGEENRDGSNHNVNWNCGEEGETDSVVIQELRVRMQKNFLTTLFLSIGTPMMLGGDEFSRTQRGNNNAYCQDNDISWMDWSFTETHSALYRFCRELIRFRKANPAFGRSEYFTGTPEKNGRADLEWFDSTGKPPNWHATGGALGCWINGTENAGTAVTIIMNPLRRARAFHLPLGDWRVQINTAAASPEDITPADKSPRPRSENIIVPSKSMLVLTDSYSR